MKKAMTEEQIRQYRAMAEPQRKLVDEGFATVVVSLDDQATVCEYNNVNRKNKVATQF